MNSTNQPQTINRVTEKRLANELKDLKKNKLEFAQAIQDETNKFIFYFLLKGDDDPKSDYRGGYYIGKIMLPSTYPDKAGDFMMLTPNGRFTPDTKICLSNSGYHPESWTPTWTIRSMLIGFLSIFLSDQEQGIAHIKESSAKRKEYALHSVQFNLNKYNHIFKQFDQFVNDDGTLKSNDEIKQSVKNSEKVTKDIIKDANDTIDTNPLKKSGGEEIEIVIKKDNTDKKSNKVCKNTKKSTKLSSVTNSNKVESEPNIFESNKVEKIKKSTKPTKIINSNKVESEQSTFGNNKVKKTKSEKLNDLFKEISSMKLSNLDITPFKKVYELVTHKLIDC